MSSKQGVAEPQDSHTQEAKEDAQVAVVVEAQALDEQLQRHADHYASGNGEEAGVDNRVGGDVGVAGELEPQGGDGGTKGLGETAEQCGPEHGAPAGAEGHVEG